MTRPESYITVNRAHGVTGYIGPDATALVAATVLRSALSLYLQTGMKPTRGVGLHDMLNKAQEITKKKYKRTQGPQAIADLTVWIETMKSALPVVEG